MARRDSEMGRGRFESAYAHNTHAHREECTSVQPLWQLHLFSSLYSFLFLCVCDPMRTFQCTAGTDEGGQREQIRNES